MINLKIAQRKAAALGYTLKRADKTGQRLVVRNANGDQYFTDWGFVDALNYIKRHTAKAA